MIDQTRLPLELVYVDCRTHLDVARAIQTMQVRGAPAIGAAAAYGMVLGASAFTGLDKQDFRQYMQQVGEILAATRPTAVNLFWAVRRMENLLTRTADLPVEETRPALLAEAEAIFREDLAMNQRMGALGQELVPLGATILTHCNAGALATTGYGTALGVIRAAQAAGKGVKVIVDETRPLLQGARLTAWELMQVGIPVTLITDNMAGYCMAKGMIDLVIVGADRITANGDVANKIGTYSVAVLAQAHGIPFYVAAPASTVDLSLAAGSAIPIEERHCDEVRQIYGQQVAPPEVDVFNPAFDVTPNGLITAIITDRGVIRPPYQVNLARAMGE